MKEKKTPIGIDIFEMMGIPFFFMISNAFPPLCQMTRVEIKGMYFGFVASSAKKPG
jgi:hypothetical protein